MTTRTLRLVFFTAFTTALSLCGCRNASPAAAEASSPAFIEFKNRSSWSFTKEQRWNDIQKYMSENATSFTRDSQGAAITYARQAGLTTSTQLQQYLDGFEQRRTGNPNAHSCRAVLDLLLPYDFSHCTQQQLTAELFQQDEEQHGYN